MKQIKRKYFFAAAVLVLIVAGVFLWRQTHPAATPIQTRTATVAKGSLHPTLVTTGLLSSPNESNLGSSVSGKLIELDVKVGDQVKKGQVLAKIDATQAQQQLNSAYSNLQSANIKLSQTRSGDQSAIDQAQQSVNGASQSLDNANANLTYTTNLYPNPTSDQQQKIDSAKASADQANNAYQSALLSLQAKQQSYTYDVQGQREQVHAAQLNVNSAQATSDNATITSPIDGTVLAVSSKLGDQIGSSGSSSSGGSSQSGGSGGSSSSGSSSQSGSSFITIADLSQLQVTATIDQADISKIAANQGVKLTLDALPGKDFTGKVSSIDPVAQTSSNVTTYNAYISLDKGDPAMRLGMSANATIDLGAKDGVLLVPNIAVRSAGGGKVVRAIIDGQPQDVTVITGLSDDNNTEITSGLTAGDTIVLDVFQSQTGSGQGTSGGGLFGGGGSRGGGFGGGG